MAQSTDKQEFPPYTSYTSFTNFISGLKETGVPSRIDRSIMEKLSGSQQSAIISTCKWFGLIDEDSIPTSQLHSLVEADEENYSIQLKELLESSYGFITDGSIDLAKATSQQLAEKFREYGISGSTVTKSVAFFLGAAKASGIKVSPHVKPPKIQRTPGQRKSSSKGQQNNAQEKNDVTPPPPPPPKKDMVCITVPLHGMPDGEIYFPRDMSQDQWKYALQMAKLILEHYRPDINEAKENTEDEVEDWMK